MPDATAQKRVAFHEMSGAALPMAANIGHHDEMHLRCGRREFTGTAIDLNYEARRLMASPTYFIRRA